MSQPFLKREELYKVFLRNDRSLDEEKDKKCHISTLDCDADSVSNNSGLFDTFSKELILSDESPSDSPLRSPVNHEVDKDLKKTPEKFKSKTEVSSIIPSRHEGMVGPQLKLTDIYQQLCKISDERSAEDLTKTDFSPVDQPGEKNIRKETKAEDLCSLKIEDCSGARGSKSRDSSIKPSVLRSSTKTAIENSLLKLSMHQNQGKKPVSSNSHQPSCAKCFVF